MLSAPSNPSLVGFAARHRRQRWPSSRRAGETWFPLPPLRRQCAAKLVHYVIISLRSASRTLLPDRRRTIALEDPPATPLDNGICGKLGETSASLHWGAERISEWSATPSRHDSTPRQN